MTTEPAALAFRPDADLLFDPAAFAHGQRVAQMFASSQLIPQHLRGKIADVTIALMMAKRLGEDPLVVMQSIYIVSGKAGWSTQYMIARANRSGIFKGRINWRIEGTGKDLVVTAFATLADTGEEVSMAASMAMAQAEGWTSNKKYQSMPEVMLRYRSATLLIRMYAADVMLGYPTVEEVETLPPEPIAQNGDVQVLPAKGRQALGLGKKASPALPDHGEQPAPFAEDEARLAEAERVAAEDAARAEEERKANEEAARRDAEEQARRSQADDDAPA